MSEFERKAREIFDRVYPATCRMPSGEPWPVEKSTTLQILIEAMDWASKRTENARFIKND